MRLLFLTDSLGENSPDADGLIRLVASLNASGIAALGVPVRYMQAFNSRVKFYAPGLTGAVLLFRPDAVVLAAPAAHLHAGPLSRAFRGLRLVSFLPRGNAGALCRLARRRCAASIDAPFPPENAPEETQRAFLDAFVAALVS